MWDHSGSSIKSALKRIVCCFHRLTRFIIPFMYHYWNHTIIVALSQRMGSCKLQNSLMMRTNGRLKKSLIRWATRKVFGTKLNGVAGVRSITNGYPAMTSQGPKEWLHHSISRRAISANAICHPNQIPSHQTSVHHRRQRARDVDDHKFNYNLEACVIAICFSQWRQRRNNWVEIIIAFNIMERALSSNWLLKSHCRAKGMYACFRAIIHLSSLMWIKR